ncbi:hypothetical protein [Rubrolithibacter danxiaensis]|uniref:hypothetical protein n=1 Tax=Rubrolithibacter danxiaensis TaxID=3390805 RepID=UPI003BF7C7BD
MKKNITGILVLCICFIAGCATVQSIVRSTFPYTATLIIPASATANDARSASSSASSFDQIFSGQGSNTSMVKEVRMASAKLEASNPADQNLGVFKSVKIYLSKGDGSDETLVATRTDVSTNVGNSLVLDIDNSRFLDDVLKGSSVKVRMEYVLRNSLNVDASVRVRLGFSTNPEAATK